jgi:peptidoglycan/xylan/chitin deacetylase (PgdA/CDA1 family)
MQYKESFFKISFLYNLFSLNFLMKLSKKSVIFPFYHIVDDANNMITNNLYSSKNKEEFIVDLCFLKKYFNPISVDEIEESKRKKKPSFLLTFDDGLSNFFTTVAPILIKEKVVAINFVNPNFIDNKGLFFRYKVNLLLNKIFEYNLTLLQKKELQKITQIPIISYLKNVNQKEEVNIQKIAKILRVSFNDFLENEKPYLTKSQMVKLINKGFYFGGHSMSHPFYKTLSLEEQLLETLESVEYLQKEFKLKNRLFSFPFSDDGVSKIFFEKIKKENIITFGTAGLKDDATENHIQRIPMEYSSKYSAETIIKGELLLYCIKRFLKRNKIIRS